MEFKIYVFKVDKPVNKLFHPLVYWLLLLFHAITFRFKMQYIYSFFIQFIFWLVSSSHTTRPVFSCNFVKNLSFCLCKNAQNRGVICAFSTNLYPLIKYVASNHRSWNQSIVPSEIETIRCNVPIEHWLCCLETFAIDSRL